MKALALPSLSRLKDVLSYDCNTGIFTWVIPPKGHPRLFGRAAGCISTGYSLIKIDNQKYKSHRLAWLYFYGEEPAGDIDHINGNRLDNSISNLRIATNPQNQANRSRNKNKSLPKGVRKIGYGMFQARISFNRKQISLGAYKTVEDAEAAYFSASKKYYGNFARAS